MLEIATNLIKLITKTDTALTQASMKKAATQRWRLARGKLYRQWQWKVGWQSRTMMTLTATSLSSAAQVCSSSGGLR